MHENTKIFIRGLCIGMFVAGIISLGAIAAITARDYRTIEQYRAIVANRDRELGELSRQLDSARKIIGQRAELDKQLMGTISKELDVINKARSEYERAIASVRLAKTIFETLRLYHTNLDNNSSGSDTP